jgi:hypothetical protein
MATGLQMLEDPQDGVRDPIALGQETLSGDRHPHVTQL